MGFLDSFYVFLGFPDSRGGDGHNWALYILLTLKSAKLLVNKCVNKHNVQNREGYSERRKGDSEYGPMVIYLCLKWWE